MDASALARELVVAGDADAAAAAFVRALSSYASQQRWDSSVIGDEPLRLSLMAWSKEANAADKEWMATQQQQQLLRRGAEAAGADDRQGRTHVCLYTHTPIHPTPTHSHRRTVLYIAII